VNGLHHLSGLLLVAIGSSAAAQAAFEAPGFRAPFKAAPALVADGKFAFAEALTEKLTRQGNQSAGVLTDPCNTTFKSTLAKPAASDCQAVIGSNLTFGNFSTNFAPIVVKVNIGPSRVPQKKD
jgi:hypothetical protein